MMNPIASYFQPFPRYPLQAMRPLASVILLIVSGSYSSHLYAADITTTDTKNVQTLATVTVSASALNTQGDEMSTPGSVLEGERLRQKRSATLGETLNNEPGVNASYFGAGANRPVIRGMDGPRVRVLSDGAEVTDASTVSPDHAVVSEPMLAERIEILRGPSALAYGGSAIGGVVNIIDNKIPTTIPSNGYEGSVDLQAGSAAKEKVGAFSVTGGTKAFAIHAEAVKRDAKDYRAGGALRNDEGGRTVENSFNETQTTSLGLSWIGDRGYVGMALTSQRSDYGLPGHSDAFVGCHPHGDHLHCGSHGHDEEEGHEHGAESGPFVALKSDRLDLRGEYREPFTGFAKLRVRAQLTDYRHDEIENDEIATTFKNKANDSRVELEHHPLAGWRGVLGLHVGNRDFRAIGEEAYVEPTDTRRQALFLIEEKRVGSWRFEMGLRQEWQKITTESAQSDRHHRGLSISTGANWQFASDYSLALSLSQNNRLPTAEELYANGVHLGTLTYELGNSNLTKESARNIDLTLRKTAGSTRFTLSSFLNHVNNYIYARSLDEHQGFQLVRYTQRDARFTGVEAQLRQQLTPNWALSVFGDYVRGRLAEGNESNRDLPRVPAARVGMRLHGNWKNWSGELETYRVARQRHVADYESITQGYTMLNLGISYKHRDNGQGFEFYAKANNLNNQLAYAHTSFIKDAAPLMGRNFVAGIRYLF